MNVFSVLATLTTLIKQNGRFHVCDTDGNVLFNFQKQDGTITVLDRDNKPLAEVTVKIP